MDRVSIESVDESNIDAVVIPHKGNFVLVMSPYVAAVIQSMSGHVVGPYADTNATREATNAVWTAFKRSGKYTYVDADDLFEDYFTLKD